MENKSLIDSLRSMGYSIDEAAEKKVFEILYGLADWFATYGTRLLEMKDSVKSTKNLFPDEFDSVLNTGIKDSVVGSWSDIPDFPSDVFSSETVSGKPGLFAKSGEDELGDTLAELESLSKKFIKASGQSGNRKSKEMVNLIADNVPEKSGRMKKSIWDQQREGIFAQGDVVSSMMETLPMMHLRMPLEEFLNMKGEYDSEMHDVLPEEPHEVLKAGNDGTSGKDAFFSGSVSGFGSLQTEGANSSVLLSPVYEPDERLLRPEETNMSSPGVSFSLGQKGRNKQTGIEELLKGFFQSIVDNRFLPEKFFSEDAGTGNFQEKIVSFRQAFMSDPVMNAQKWTDAIRVRQSDSNVFMAYETPLPVVKGNMPEVTDTDSSNRTINITVNGTGASQETINAISEGLMEVDMGMTLRHFKSPMMA